MALDLRAAVKIKASVDGTQEIDGLQRSLNKVDRQAGGLQGAFNKLRGMAGGLGNALGSIVPAAGIAGLVLLGKRTIDAADNLNDLSQKTGVSVESLSRFQGAADDSGTSIDQVGKAMAKFSKGLVTAGAGTNQFVSEIKSSMSRSLDAVKSGEEEQTRAVKEQADRRLDALQAETDDRLREINKRYRNEQTLLDDNFDDQADRAREAADETLRLEQRRISQRYDAIQESIQQNESLSEQDKKNQIAILKAQEDDELNSLQKRFSESQKLRDRQFRDARRAEQDALEERRRIEEEGIKKGFESQKKVLDAGTEAQINAIKAKYSDAAESLKSGSQGVGAALASLGISAVNASNQMRPVDQLMMDVADKFAAMPDGANKTALAMNLFGKSGADLIPMLNMGREGLSQYAATIDKDLAAASDKFNDALNAITKALAGPFNDIIAKLLPVLEKVALAIVAIINAFVSLPEPLQNTIIGLSALLFAINGLSGPVTILYGGFKLLAGLKLGATIAGWLPVIAQIGPAVMTAGQLLIGVLSGPVGWIALLVAAGVAIYAFRDQIGAAFQAIGQTLSAAAQGFYNIFIKPVGDWFTGLYNGIVTAFSKLGEVLKAPFQAVANFIRGIVNGILGGIEGAINGAIGALNRIIAGANRALAIVKAPQIPFIPSVALPRFAEGGMVTGPTVAMVGEGGEPEYIVPQSKAAGFAANWMAGKRGAGAIPRFAEGGVVMPSTANVSIQTGPVTQMNGTNYVTTQDMSRAVQAGVQQTLALLRNDLNTRRAVGIA